MRNELCPQNYVDMVVEYVNRSGSWKFDEYYSFEGVVEYCFKNTSEFDPGDEKYIEKIVRKTLESLEYAGYIFKTNGVYRTKKKINKITPIKIEDDLPPIKSITSDRIKKLMEIKIDYGEFDALDR